MVKYFNILVLLIISQFAFSQVDITGTITDNENNPVSEVDVVLSGTTPQSTQTDASGNYSFTVTSGEDYTITPSKAGYTFSPEYETVVNITANTVKDFTATLDEITVSGNIDLDGSGLSDVTLNYTVGTGVYSTTTDANGDYQFTATKDTAVTITPEKAGYIFSPDMIDAQSGYNTDTTVNFTATLDEITVSGNIDLDGSGLSDVTVNYTVGAGVYSTTTDTNGDYQFSATKNTALTITPEKTGYFFSPDMVDAQSGYDTNTVRNFQATISTLKISGIIADSLDNPAENIAVVSISSGKDTVFTDASGYYEFTLPNPANVEIIPFKQSYTFDPLQYECQSLNKDSVVNFEIRHERKLISGHVYNRYDNGIEGVLVIFAGTEADSVITDASGYYEYNALVGSPYALSLLKTGYDTQNKIKTVLGISNDTIIDFEDVKLFPPSLTAPANGLRNVYSDSKFMWDHVLNTDGSTTHSMRLIQENVDTTYYSNLSLAEQWVSNLTAGDKYQWSARIETPTDTSEWADYYDFTTTTQNEFLTFREVDTSIEKEGKMPVIIIHKSTFYGIPSQPINSLSANFIDYVHNDEELSASFKLYEVLYYSNQISIHDLAADLRTKIEEAGLNEQQIAIMGYGMGGLLARSFMNEYTYTQGCYEDLNCGSNVSLLITLGTPHHGTPITNGQAQQDKIRPEDEASFNELSYLMFHGAKYDELSRTDLHWDNYDSFLDYATYSGEANTWLANLNTMTQYDEKTICYAGKITGALSNNVSTEEERYIVSAYHIEHSYLMENDGFVPFKSADFDGHTVKKNHFFDEYNPFDLAQGKPDSLLFKQLNTDLSDVAPPKLIVPSDSGIVLKHSQLYNIRWVTPSDLDLIDLFVSYNNGANWDTLQEKYDVQLKEYQWMLPDTNVTTAKIKLAVSQNASAIYDPSESEFPFTIYHEKIEDISINSTVYNRGDTIRMTWNHEGVGKTAEILYTDTVNNYTQILSSDFALSNGANSFDWIISHEVTPSKTGNISIEILDMESLYGDTAAYKYYSKQFTVYEEPKITLIAPNSAESGSFGINGERLFIDSTYTVKWQTEGIIEKVNIFLCNADTIVIDTIASVNHTPDFASNGTYDWLVPELYSDTLYIKLEGKSNDGRTTVLSPVQYHFRINKLPVILSPENTDSAISITPCITLSAFDNAVEYNIKISNLNQDTYYSKEFTASDTVFCLPPTLDTELLPYVTYYLSVQAITTFGKSYGVTQTFTTDSVMPEAFTLASPEVAAAYNNDEVSFKWNHSVGASSYELLLSQEGSSNISYSNLSKNDTTYTIDPGYTNGYNDTIFWSVIAKNDFGQVKKDGYYFETAKIQEPEYYKVLSNNWHREDNSVLATSDTFYIWLNDQMISGSTSLKAMVTDGYLSIDKIQEKVTECYGKVHFMKGNDGYFPLFTGELTLDTIYLKPISQEINIETDLVPQLDPEKMTINYFNLKDYIVKVDYDDYYYPPFPGLTYDSRNDMRIKINYFKIKPFGEITGDVDNLDVSVGVIKFGLSDLELDTYNDLLYVKAQKADLILLDNDFVNWGVNIGYKAKFGLTLDGENIGYMALDDSGNPEWGNKAAFPDIDLFGTELIAPYMNFKYFDTEKKWGIDMRALLVIPWVSKESIKKFKKNNELSAPSFPRIEANYQFLDNPPYVKLIDIQGKSLGDPMTGIGIGIPGVFALEGINGRYYMESTSNGDFKKLELNAGAKLGFGPLSFLTVDGQLNYMYQASPVIHQFELTGDAKLFSIVNLANSDFLIEYKNTKSYENLYFSGQSQIAFPTKSDPIIYGSSQIYYLSSKKKSNHSVKSEVAFEGELKFELKEGLVDYHGVKWPSSTILLRQKAMFGKIDIPNSNNDKYGFAFNLTRTFRYPKGVSCSFSSSFPYLESCNTVWKTKTKNIGFFQPLHGTPQCGFDTYKLASFRKSKAMTHMTDGQTLDGFKYMRAESRYDSLLVEIPKIQDDFIDFAVTYTGDVSPDVILKNPDGDYYSGIEYLEQNPEQRGEDGYILSFPHQTGEWSILIPNSAEVEDYTVSALTGVPTYPFTFNSVNIDNQGILNIQGSFGNAENDTANVKFYYTTNDTLPGISFKPDATNFINGQVNENFDISLNETGTYKIYAIVSDGINLPQKYIYETEINIAYSGEVLPPDNFNFIRTDNEMYVNWNDSQGSKKYKLFIGNNSAQYTDSLEIESNEFTFRFESDTSEYYFIVKGESTDGRLSAPSVEQYIKISDYQVDTIPPATPSYLNVDVNLTGDEDEAYALFTWENNPDFAGFILKITETESNKQAFIPVDNQDSLAYTILEKGKTYTVAVQSRDEAFNYSEFSNETEFNFFSLDDLDFDNMIDQKEILYFGDIDITNDPDEDYDGDNLANLYEMNNGLNPNSVDTDDDRVWDDADANPTTALDEDNDMMADDWELYHNVWEPNEDADGDLLLNKDEYLYRTNPNETDTDGGGMSDYDEIQEGLNPLNANDDVEENGRIITEIVNYTAVHYGDSARIDWQTQEEDLLTGFNVYRRYSEDETWIQINKETIARPDDSNTAHDYTFIDNNTIPTEKVYYLIEAVSISDAREEAFEIEVDFTIGVFDLADDDKTSVTAYPNPFNEQLSLLLNEADLKKSQNLQITAVDISGKVVIDRLIKTGNQDKVFISINTSQLPSGIYLFTIKTEHNENTVKMLKK